VAAHQTSPVGGRLHHFDVEAAKAKDKVLATLVAYDIDDD